MYATELRNEIAFEVYKIKIIDPHTHMCEDDLSSHVVDIIELKFDLWK